MVREGASDVPRATGRAAAAIQDSSVDWTGQAHRALVLLFGWPVREDHLLKASGVLVATMASRALSIHIARQSTVGQPASLMPSELLLSLHSETAPSPPPEAGLTWAK